MGHEQGFGLGNPFYAQSQADYEREMIRRQMNAMSSYSGSVANKQPEVNPVLLLLED